MIARKNALNPNNVAISQAFAARAQLTQERNLALKRQDYKEAAQIERELETLTTLQGAASGRRDRGPDTHADLMARVNERNRKANLEAVRRAEAEQAARKRQERRAALAGAGINPATFDVSARLKTVPKIHHQSRLVIHAFNLFAK
jgi:RNA polymerase-associated protein RTF1